MPSEPQDRSAQGESQPALASIEAIIQDGKAVISADNSTIVEAVKDAVRYGRVATFYLSHYQAQMVNRLYWTPERIKQFGMEPVPQEEKERIQRELGVRDTGHLYSNRVECECGETYGAFEFLAQGIREHGREMVGAVLDFENTSVIRINPPAVAICTNCNRKLLAGHYYCWVNGYGCCQSLNAFQVAEPM